jgi:hypothetical protein
LADVTKRGNSSCTSNASCHQGLLNRWNQKSTGHLVTMPIPNEQFSTGYFCRHVASRWNRCQNCPRTRVASREYICCQIGEPLDGNGSER